MPTRCNICRHFSLLELTLSIGVLAIIIAASFSFISSIQNTWQITYSKQESFENARIALDIMARDIETAYFDDGKAPFWHWKPASNLPSDYTQYQNGHLAFIGQTPITPNDFCTEDYFEIKYQLYFSTAHDENEGWLRRSVTGNKLTTFTVVDGKTVYDDNPKYNWLPGGNSNLRASLNYFNSSTDGAAFTANAASSGEDQTDYTQLIPYVLDLSFSCDTDTDTNRIIQPDTTTVAANNSLASCKSLAYSSTNIFPSLITVSITLLDKSSWDKWIALCGAGIYHSRDNYLGETAAAKAFREAHQTTFSRTVLLGDRGQE